MTSRPIVESYLAELASAMPAGDGTADIVDEARDHLWQAVAAHQQGGASSHMAQQRAVDEFGTIGQLSAPFSAAVIVRDARRQAVRQLAVLAVLAVCGISCLRLIPVIVGETSLLTGQPPLVAKLVTVTILAPSLALWLLSRAGPIWTERKAARGLRWLQRVEAMMFILALPTAAALVGLAWSNLLHGPAAWIWMAAAAALAHLATHWVYAVRFGRPPIFR